MNGDQILTQLWVLLILFGGGGFIWLRVLRPIYQDTVKPFLAAQEDYVTPPPNTPAKKDPSSPEQPKEREREQPERAAEPIKERQQTDKKVDTQETEKGVSAAATPRPTYTQEQIERAERAARDRGAAEALGTIMGLGLLPKERESEVMERLYGKRGRRWQTVRPIIEEVVGQVAAPVAVMSEGEVQL